MKKTILAIISVVGLLSPRIGQAQGTVYSSNMGDASTGSFAVANNLLIAQEFAWEGYMVNGVELTPDCILDSVQLQMDTASGNPSGFTVSIYTVGSSGPGTLLGTLTGDPNPDNPGVYTYTTSGITLSPATGYFVVVTSATLLSQGAYNWSTTTSNAQVASGLTIDESTSYLTIEDVYGDSVDGLTWNPHVRQDIGKMAIYGTPVPEPSLCLLFVCGAGVIHFFCRRWKSA